jgi:hypothetical protein
MTNRQYELILNIIIWTIFGSMFIGVVNCTIRICYIKYQEYMIHTNVRIEYYNEIQTVPVVQIEESTENSVSNNNIHEQYQMPIAYIV